MTILALITLFSLICSSYAAASCGLSKQTLDSVHYYPSESNPVYQISYNKTTMQANYVRYIGTKGDHNCDFCAYYANDPFGINPLINEDYAGFATQYGLLATGLVPNSDYGVNTFVITNAVPLYIGFRNGVWAELDKYLQVSWSEFIIYKGCDYDYNYFVTSMLQKKVYIPIGCYYVVTDNEEEILDWGYVENQPNSQKQSKLPWWMQCPGAAPDKVITHSDHTDYIISISVLSFVLMFCCFTIVFGLVGGIFVYYRTRKNAVNARNTKNEMEMEIESGKVTENPKGFDLGCNPQYKQFDDSESATAPSCSDKDRCGGCSVCSQVLDDAVSN